MRRFVSPRYYPQIRSSARRELAYSVVSGDTIGDRLYALAARWQTYDPTYSVIWGDFSTSD